MKKVGLIYDDIYLKHENPPGHPESAARLVKIMSVLRESDIWESLIQIKPRKATEKELEAVHTRTYVEAIKKTQGYADPDTFVSPGSYKTALYAAGAVLEAIDRIKRGEIERAFCAVRPPGHHAEAGRAMGFCLFNNVAVGARYAQSTGFERIFIVDFDVHHGNGTQHMFEEDDTVYYFSTHQYPHYPGTGGAHERGKGKGEGFTYNVPMSGGSGVKEYQAVYHEVLPVLIRDFDPDLLMVSAGYDIHASDPLSNIYVSDDGIRSIVDGVLSGKDVPAVFTLEGGYNLAALAVSVLITVRELLTHL